MKKTIRKVTKPATHHAAEEMPPMGVVVQKQNPRAFIYQIIIPFALATVLGVALCAGSVHLYRTLSFRFIPMPRQKGTSVLVQKGNSLEITKSLGTLSALYVEPIDLVRLIDKHNDAYTLVDVRSADRFERAHIKTAVNMPNVTKSSFSSVSASPVILYGDGPMSRDVLEAAKVFSSASKDVRILSVGWNQFRFFPNVWIPEDMWNTLQVDDYLQITEGN